MVGTLAKVMKEQNEQFAGLTYNDCPIECSAEYCLITGRGFCGHPHKSGLMGNDNHNPKVVERYNLARRVLARISADAKVTQ